MMLSTISHSMPPSYPPSPATAMTTSLPIIPQRRALAQRPKLQIDTQQRRTFGKGSTSLRLDTLSAVSPTVRNTFSNAYAQQQQQLQQQQKEQQQKQQTTAAAAPSTTRPSKPRLCIDSNLSNTTGASTPSSASTLSSTLTSASNDSATIAIPYKQPHNLTSILSNSPARSLLPRKMAISRPLFPAEKRVSFRTPLEEEIKTVKYTMAHSDIESSSSTLSLSTDDSESEEPESHSAESHSVTTSTSPEATTSTPLVQSPTEQTKPSAFSTLESSPRPNAPRVGEKRDSSSSEDDSDSCPETPVAGRRKRRRDWRWTLGPLPGSNKSASSSGDESS